VYSFPQPVEKYEKCVENVIVLIIYDDLSDSR